MFKPKINKKYDSHNSSSYSNRSVEDRLIKKKREYDDKLKYKTTLKFEQEGKE